MNGNRCCRLRTAPKRPLRVTTVDGVSHLPQPWAAHGVGSAPIRAPVPRTSAEEPRRETTQNRAADPHRSAGDRAGRDARSPGRGGRGRADPQRHVRQRHRPLVGLRGRHRGRLRRPPVRRRARRHRQPLGRDRGPQRHHPPGRRRTASPSARPARPPVTWSGRSSASRWTRTTPTTRCRRSSARPATPTRTPSPRHGTERAQVAFQLGGSPDPWRFCVDDVSLLGGVAPSRTSRTPGRASG